MKVGLLGGSFNPPHQGHIYVSEQALKKLKLNQVWWIPTAYNPLKDKSIYDSYENRLRKSYELTAKKPKIKVKKFDEIYTYILLRKLKSRYKNIEFFWIAGADNFERFHHWDNFKEISKKVTITIFSREKFLSRIKKTKSWKFLAQHGCKIFYTKNIDISSTKLRNLKNV